MNVNERMTSTNDNNDGQTYAAPMATNVPSGLKATHVTAAVMRVKTFSNVHSGNANDVTWKSRVPTTKRVANGCTVNVLT